MATQVFAKKQGRKFRGEYSITLLSHCVGSLSNILNLLPLFNIRKKQQKQTNPTPPKQQQQKTTVLHTELHACIQSNRDSDGYTSTVFGQ